MMLVSSLYLWRIMPALLEHRLFDALVNVVGTGRLECKFIEPLAGEGEREFV
jgi:hypothetical protein